jgi:hypothetical protein
MHAALALAGHHVLSTQFQDHRQAALQTLRVGLDELNPAHFQSVLDTIILLFSLDVRAIGLHSIASGRADERQEAQSAYGNWNVHLSGAYSLLEACGGVEEWTKSTRAIVQVGMLVWYVVSVFALSLSNTHRAGGTQ